MTATPPIECVPRLDLAAPAVGDAVAIAALLADPIRASILAMLASGPVCVCEMASALGAHQNSVSNHLARLREAGLVRAVQSEADARFRYYERDEAALVAARKALAALLA